MTSAERRPEGPMPAKPVNSVPTPPTDAVVPSNAGSQHASTAKSGRAAAAERLPVARPLPAGAVVDPQAAKPAAARPIPVSAMDRPRLIPDADGNDEGSPSTEKAIKAAPPWLISTVIHMLLMIALGLLYIAPDLPQIVNLNVSYSEELGQQLEDDILDIPSLDTVDNLEPILSHDINPITDPLAAPPDLRPTLDALYSSSQITAPSVGLALTGREKGMKSLLLAKYGGDASTEESVLRALEWLKKNQRKDGSWSLQGPYSDGATYENVTAATAMALLAFQGAGNTHQEGPFQQQVVRGWAALSKMQKRDGDFFQGGNYNHRLYSQAQATIAICELYGMTRDPELRAPAQLAVDYAVRNQAPEGGWRYTPGSDSDTSVTGWFVMALQSAMMAGLEIPSETWDRVSVFLDSVEEAGGSRYRYQPYRSGHSPAMTAEALLCRQYIGWARSDERLQQGVNYLSGNPILWRDKNVYYWYYATQVMHHMEGDAWKEWNRVMKAEIPKNQELTGEEKGSWSSAGDRWGTQGGRLYMTCLCTYMLEVYYRHLPIYSYRTSP